MAMENTGQDQMEGIYNQRGDVATGARGEINKEETNSSNQSIAKNYIAPLQRRYFETLPT